MLDGDVRLALHEHLRMEHREELNSTVFVDEMGIAGEVRIDTAVLNGDFSGFEIKSARDTLRRLPKQVEIYSRVLDFATLVVAENHVAHARPLLPGWWGIIEARPGDDGRVRLVQRRRPKRNRNVDRMYLCTLLWRDEVLSELEVLGAARGLRGKSKTDLWLKLSEITTDTEIRQIVRERLKARPLWRVGA